LRSPSKRATGDQDSKQSCPPEKPSRESGGCETSSSQCRPIRASDTFAAGREQGKLRDSQTVRAIVRRTRTPLKANKWFRRGLHGTNRAAYFEDIRPTQKRLSEGAATARQGMTAQMHSGRARVHERPSLLRFDPVPSGVRPR